MSRRGIAAARYVPVLLLYLALVGCTSPEVIANVLPPGDTVPTPPDTTVGPSAVTVTVEYSTFFGGSALEEAREPVLFADGRLLFGVRTYSSNMPASPGAIQTQFAGGAGDTFLAILSPDGSSLLAGTYLGGSGQERPPYGMELTSNGDIVVTSGTGSSDFPVTPGAFRPSRGSTTSDGYVCRLSPTLTTRRWCTYINAWPRGGLALASNDDPLLTGGAEQGTGFVPTSGSYQTDFRGTDDAFVLRLNSSGTAAVFATLVGGTGTAPGEGGISLNVRGSEIYLGGISQSSDFPTTSGSPQTAAGGRRDGFLVRLSGDGRNLNYGTLVGGSGEDESKHRNELLPDGSVILGGETQSASMPKATGSLSGPASGWVGKLNSSGTAFDFLRYIGGNGTDRFVDRAADSQGRIYVVGSTTSSNFPTTSGALRETYGGGQDGVFVVLDHTGKILYSTYIGGSGLDGVRGVEVGPDGGVFIVGGTASSDFPVSGSAYQRTRGGDQDGFAMKLRVSGSN